MSLPKCQTNDIDEFGSFVLTLIPAGGCSRSVAGNTGSIMAKLLLQQDSYYILTCKKSPVAAAVSRLGATPAPAATPACYQSGASDEVKLRQQHLLRY